MHYARVFIKSLTVSFLIKDVCSLLSLLWSVVMFLYLQCYSCMRCTFFPFLFQGGCRLHPPASKSPKKMLIMMCIYFTYKCFRTQYVYIYEDCVIILDEVANWKKHSNLLLSIYPFNLTLYTAVEFLLCPIYLL